MFAPASGLIGFSSELAIPSDTFFGVSFPVTSTRGDGLNNIFFVMCLGFHFCGDDSSEEVCFGLNSMVINFCISLWAQPKCT